MSGGERWYVVQTQPNREERAVVHLQRQGFITYLPRYQRMRRHARRAQAVVRPLFPRYLFVMLDLARDRWRSIYSTFGVSGLLSAGEAPLAVPTGLIDEIRAREGQEGIVRLGLPAGVGVGSRVKLIDGIFADAEGIIERVADASRVAVLLKLLGRETRVFVPTGTVGTI